MNNTVPDLSFLGVAGFMAGAAFSLGAALWIIHRRDIRRPDRGAAILAAFLSAAWCAFCAANGPDQIFAHLLESARNLAFMVVIFRLFSNDGRDESLKLTRPLIYALVFVVMLRAMLTGYGFVAFQGASFTGAALQVDAILSMLVAIGALVLLHNLYVGAAPGTRRFIRWSATGLSIFFAYDLNFYTVGYLLGETPDILSELQGFVAVVAMAFLAIGGGVAAAGLEFKPSRAFTFQSLSLIIIGAYLIIMVLVTRSLALIEDDVARAGQVVFVVVALIAAGVFLPSARMRAWARVTAAKHLFQHRYDFREEWLRFTQTLGRGTQGSSTFNERAIQAMADITDSPSGLLLIPDEEGQLRLAARWNMPTVEVPAVAGSSKLAKILEQEAHILALDEVRRGVDYHGEASHVPEWMIEEKDLWALVPLLHFDRFVAAIVLVRPRVERRLDWEDFDLLRVAGQQLASYLAEQAGQEALLEADRFDEFNRRIAFVMHDVKNLASQLSLLARNAEKHADNPDFRADMLVTLRNSSEKLTTLLARLGRYGSGPAHENTVLDLQTVAHSLCERFKLIHPVSLVNSEPVYVLANQEALLQALVHLVQNAVDASKKDDPVYLDVSSDGIRGTIEIVDTGCGMSAGFVHNGLFKPFVSSKDGGFGIGAFEAREMIKKMGGRLDVESRLGLGTRFSVTFPCRKAAQDPSAEDSMTSEAGI